MTKYNGMIELSGDCLDMPELLNRNGKHYSSKLLIEMLLRFAN